MPLDPNEQDPGSEPMLVRSLRLMQENLRIAGPVVLSGYMLISAILVFGGIGFALDRWLDRSPWFLLGGLLLGIVVGFVELARIVFWKK